MNEQFTQEDIQQNKLMAALSYFGLLVLVPLFAAPNSGYARFHANQGLVLLIFGVCCGVAVGILSGVAVGLLGALSLGGFFGFAVFTYILAGALSLGLFILGIIGIVNAATGKAQKLPLIGNITILK